MAMLRITTLRGNDSIPILRLEGKFLEPWVDELRRTCLVQAPLRLDLSAVTFVDAAGVRCLRELIKRGAFITASSSFVSALLEREKP
jgi:anti-anti-sigma regulatory factor